MNLWITLLLPILGLGVVAKIVLYYFSLEVTDKTIPLIVVSAGHIIGAILIVMLLNKMGISTFLILTAIMCIISNLTQIVLDDGTLVFRIGRGKSAFVSFVIYFLAIFASFYFFIL